MFDNGCEWIRCDFHLQTRKDKEFKYTGEDNSFISDYVNKLESEKIKIGVITNHNKFDLQEYTYSPSRSCTLYNFSLAFNTLILLSVSILFSNTVVKLTVFLILKNFLSNSTV